MVDGFCNSERRVLHICHLPMDPDQLDADTFRHIVEHCLLTVVCDRPIVRRPKVLLLDEASSSLDATAERLVQRALGATNATVVLVAHRLSSVLLADSVVVIEDGVVTERGTADELRAKGGWFARNFYPV